jgi:hypothetical protein
MHFSARQSKTTKAPSHDEASRSLTRPVPSNPFLDHPLLKLQRAIGNQNTERLLRARLEGSPSVPPIGNEALQSPGEPLDSSTRASMKRHFGHYFSRVPIHPPAIGEIQPKLAINKPGDKYEQEADRIADQVTATQAHTDVSNVSRRIQRLPGRTVRQADTAPASVGHALASPGNGLEPTLREDMEQRFGHDFSRVRVHWGAAAEQSARDLNATAYTLGHEIVFGAGRFRPHTPEGKRLLTHELAHVVQASDHGDTGIFRQADSAVQQVDPTVQQSMTPEGISRLSNEEIDHRIQAILDQLRTLKDGTPEHQAAHANLTLLEQEVNSRGYYSPVLVKDGLISAVGELLSKVAGVEQSLTAVFGSGVLNQGAIDLFKSRYGRNGINQAQWISAALNEAGQLTLTAPDNDPNAAFEAFGAAGTRLVAAMFGAQLLSVWLAFLQLSDVVLQRVAVYSVEHLFLKMEELWLRFDKPFAELSSLDPARVQATAVALPALLNQLVAEHTSLIAEIEKAVRNAQKIMQVAAFVELVTSLASLRISLPPRTPGPPLVGVGIMAGGFTSSGALVGARLVITVEWVEMIRRLIAAGVIAVPVAAAGVRAGVIMMASNAPSGTPPVPGTAAEVVSSGTTPLEPGQSPLGKYGIDKYGTFANRPNDKFAGHELLQNLWLEVKGFGRRLVGPASRENPAVALTHAEHVEVGRQQYKLGLFDRQKIAQMSAAEIIESNALAMKRAGIPDFVIEALKREALMHAATLKPPVGGGVPVP